MGKRETYLFSDLIFLYQQFGIESNHDLLDEDVEIARDKFVNRIKIIESRIKRKIYSINDSFEYKEFVENNVDEKNENKKLLSLTKRLQGKSIFSSLMSLAGFDQIYLDTIINFLKAKEKFDDKIDPTSIFNCIYYMDMEGKSTKGCPYNVPLEFIALIIDGCEYLNIGRKGMIYKEIINYGLMDNEKINDSIKYLVDNKLVSFNDSVKLYLVSRDTDNTTIKEYFNNRLHDNGKNIQYIKA